MFANFLDYISDLQIISFGSFIFGILSLILACFFYKKSRRFKKILYLKKSFNVIENFTQRIDEKLSLKYDNKDIQNLTITNILLCNAGNETIDFTDIAKADPIKIYSPNKENILKLDVIYSDNCANSFKLLRTHNKNSYILHFDYIDKCEKVVIRALHSGKSSEDIALEGHIKGVGEIIEGDLKKHIDPLSRGFYNLLIFLILSSMLFFTASLNIFSNLFLIIEPYKTVLDYFFYFILLIVAASFLYKDVTIYTKIKNNIYFFPNIFLNPNITCGETDKEINRK